MFVEIKKQYYNEILSLLKYMNKDHLVKALEQGSDSDYKPPLKITDDPYSSSEGSAEEEDVDMGDVHIDTSGFWSLK